MKRSETQVIMKINNYTLCHLAVFVDTRSALNLRWSTFFPLNYWNNPENSLTIGFIKSLVQQNFDRSDKI